jgi:hypothetical protein
MTVHVRSAIPWHRRRDGGGCCKASDNRYTIIRTYIASFSEVRVVRRPDTVDSLLGGLLAGSRGFTPGFREKFLVLLRTAFAVPRHATRACCSVKR